MKQLSSNTHPIVHHWLRRVNWHKWAALLGLAIVASWFTGIWILWVPVVLLGSLIGGIAYAVFELGMTNFAMEVWDDGDCLKVLRRDETESIPIGQLAQATYEGKWNPPRAFLQLRTPCRWGTTITFLPDCALGRDRARAMIEELNARIPRI